MYTLIVVLLVLNIVCHLFNVYLVAVGEANGWTAFNMVINTAAITLLSISLATKY